MKHGSSGELKANKKVRILIVDDSAFMRKALTKMVESDPEIEVIGTASDGIEGVEKVQSLKPDLVTMDIEMPRMDGLTALREIMEKQPTPVMMVSSISTEGAQATLDALDLGAVDFIPKQSSFVSLDIVKIRDDLLAKIKSIARRKSILMTRYRLKRSSLAARQESESERSSAPRIKVIGKRNHAISIIMIGSSTGGPPALQSVLTRLPRNLPVGVIIAQHMPAQFTTSLAERLNSQSQVTVCEAKNGQVIEPGLVLIAPGGQNMTVRRSGSKPIVRVSSDPKDTLYKPCVDVTINSAAETYGRATMGVILTGMGRNGVEGLQNVRSRGGIIIAQNEESCVVYGMPKAAIDAEIVDHIAPIDQVADEMLSYF